MDMAEIKREIERLEAGDTNYSSCTKLATLYTVRDGMTAPDPAVSAYSYADGPASEFRSAINGVPMDYVLDVIEEHLDAVKIMFPKEYSAVLRRLKN